MCQVAFAGCFTWQTCNSLYRQWAVQVCIDQGAICVPALVPNGACVLMHWSSDALLSMDRKGCVKEQSLRPSVERRIVGCLFFFSSEICRRYLLASRALCYHSGWSPFSKTQERPARARMDHLRNGGQQPMMRCVRWDLSEISQQAHAIHRSLNQMFPPTIWRKRIH